MMKRIAIILAFILALPALITGCAGKRESLSVAEQYGLAYAPVTIMKEKGFLEKRLPGVEIEWKQMANTTAIREAMVSGGLDIGFMALPPFLIGADKGMEWKILSGLSEVPVGLVTLEDDIASLKDFEDSDRIVLPQPGSIQHILLSMASERELGDARRFDNRIVTMTHPDGMGALLARGDVAAHFTSPPYLFMESEIAGAHVVLTGKEAMGEDFTFVAGVSTDSFSRAHGDWETAFGKALAESMDFIENNPLEAAEILSKVYGLQADRIFEYITRDDMVYTPELKGLKAFHDFMVRQDMIGDLGDVEYLVRREAP